MRHHISTRKPLTELPRSKVKSPTNHKSDHFLSPFSSTPLLKKEYVDNCSKPTTDFHDFHSEKLNPVSDSMCILLLCYMIHLEYDNNYFQLDFHS